MSTNKTENLGLHSWVETDPVKMSEFNENFNALDSAHAALSETLYTESAAVNRDIDSLNTNVAAIQSQAIKISAGNYIGDGATTKTLYFSGAPKLVIVRQHTYAGIYKSMIMFCSDNRALNYTGSSSFAGSDVIWSADNVNWTVTTSGNSDLLNITGLTYYYIAFCI